MAPRPSRRGGFTLVELLFTLVLLGVLLSLATPAMGAWVRRTRVNTVLNQLAADLYYARMLAVRSGHSVVVKVAPNSPNVCIEEYTIEVQAMPPRVAGRTSVKSAAPGVCLTMNQNGSPLGFNSRGLPTPLTNRTFWARAGVQADSIRIAMGGRVLRFNAK